MPQKRGSDAINRVLIGNEEASLVEWILSMDRRSMPPRQAIIRQMAMLLLREHGVDATLGQHWVHNFIDRYSSIKASYNRKYDTREANARIQSF